MSLFRHSRNIIRDTSRIFMNRMPMCRHAVNLPVDNNSSPLVNVENTITNELYDEKINRKVSVLSPESGKHFDFSDYAPELAPSYNLAAYANRSVTLQKLIDLGVDLSKIEKRKGVPEYIAGLDFVRDIQGHIQFLNDVGVPADALGHFITKNPLIFKEDLNSLATRIEYLNTEGYSQENIAHIVTSNPFWLMFSVDRIENRLSFFKQHFDLKYDGMCPALVCRGPRLITYNLTHVRTNTFSVREEMGFNKYETRKMVLSYPKIWMISNKSLVGRFNVVHNEMKVPHDLISKQPHALLCRESRLKQRHLFLASRNLAQYDPLLPNYIPMLTLASSSDLDFAVNVAKSSFYAYSDFLKTL